MSKIKLLDGVNVDTDGPARKGDGGGKVLTIYGTSLGGGSITIELSNEDTTNWVPITYSGSPFVATSFEAYYIRRISQGQYVRARLTGSTGASNVNVDLT